MDTSGSTLQCRLMCASASAYGIDPATGEFTPPEPYYAGAGYKERPVPVVGGDKKINAALVGTTSDGVVVAFRGTIPPWWTIESLLDWLQDFMAEPESVNGLPGKVHTGFYDAVNAIWSSVQTTVGTTSLPLFITGHSKGGPMASLAAILFKNAGITPTSVYTFASPKPGNIDFAKAYDAAIQQTSYENYLDIVPFVPPSNAVIELASKIPWIGKLFERAEGWDYMPVGKRLYIEENGTVVPDTDSLDELRIAEIIGKLVEGDLQEIVGAHCHLCAGKDCAGGYMQGACAGEICA